MGAVNPGGMGGYTMSASLLQFQVREIMLSKLYALSQAGAWSNVGEPKHDMAFLPNSAQQDCQRREGVWPGSSVDAPTPSPPPLPG